MRARASLYPCSCGRVSVILRVRVCASIPALACARTNARACLRAYASAPALAWIGACLRAHERARVRACARARVRVRVPLSSAFVCPAHACVCAFLSACTCPCTCSFPSACVCARMRRALRTWRTDPSPQTIRSALSSLRSSRVSSAPASAATRVRSSFMRIGSLPSTATSVHTPGHGVKARTRLCSVRAEWRARSACASSALILSALVALASSCGVSAEAQLSSHTEGSDSTSRRVPRSKSSSSSSGACRWRRSEQERNSSRAKACWVVLRRWGGQKWGVRKKWAVLWNTLRELVLSAWDGRGRSARRGSF
eukprot:6183412-Pleurochrysis_carterae.AAC.3